MGEAKRRGTIDQRIQGAKAKHAELAGLQLQRELQVVEVQSRNRTSDLFCRALSMMAGLQGVMIIRRNPAAESLTP